jgi:hypothetical protein
MESRRCAGCGRAFWLRSQVPGQRYCCEAACQRARRRCWQRGKRQSDADYRENRARASVRGRKAIANTGATSNYRRTHPRLRAQPRRIPAAATRSPAACGFVEVHKVCKDGRVDAGFSRSVSNLAAGPGGGRGVCKDGRVDGGNHFGINAVVGPHFGAFNPETGLCRARSGRRCRAAPAPRRRTDSR